MTTRHHLFLPVDILPEIEHEAFSPIHCDKATAPGLAPGVHPLSNLSYTMGELR